MTTFESPARVEVRGRFHRSVQLIRDWQGPPDLQDYLITPTVRDLTQRIVRELQAPGGTRAWSITGPYGTGKSAFALFLTKILTNRLNGIPEAGLLRKGLHLGKQKFFPVLLVGERAPLKPSLLRALSSTLASIDHALAREVEEISQQNLIDDSAVIRYFERAAEEVKRHGYKGLLIVVDEFGKFLEYAASNLHCSHSVNWP